MLPKIISLMAYLAAIAILAIVIQIRPASSHSWYDQDCCTIDDCRPISGVDGSGQPWSEIEEVAGGYRWTSSKTGASHFIAADDRMANGNPRIRPSRDGHFHGCETNGSYGPEHSPPVALCLYVPSMF